MNAVHKARAAALALLVIALGTSLAGCSSRSGAVRAPAGMKVGPSLTDAQVQALEQKKQARGQQPAIPVH